LALVANRQPITRGEIEQIRGVAVNPNIIKTLLERSWIRVVGHRDVPGKPELLGTTRDFLDYFSLQKLDDLPTLAHLKELEDLRFQLSLPGAEKVAASADPESAVTAEETLVSSRAAAPVPEADAAGGGESSAPQDADEPNNDAPESGDEDDELDAASMQRHLHGLVARSAADDEF
jgi:segregation and condensation protein B